MSTCMIQTVNYSRELIIVMNFTILKIFNKTYLQVKFQTFLLIDLFLILACCLTTF